MPMATGDVVLLTYWTRLASQQLLVTLHYRYETPGAPTDSVDEQLQDIATEMANTGVGVNTIVAALRAVTPDNVAFERCTAQRIKPTRSVYASAPMSVNGTFADSATATNICASVTKRTVVPGRKGVGHCQWPPLPSAVYINGLLDAGFRTTQLQAWADQLKVSFVLHAATAEEFAMVPCLPAATTGVPYKVDNTVAQPTVRTMHRRTVGLGI